MKHLLLLLLSFTALHAAGQQTAYQPLHPDTSCTWIFDYYYYDSSFGCKGEKTAFVEKDTVIGAYHYAKVVTYGTGYDYSDDPPLCKSRKTYLDSVHVLFLREDTATRRILRPDGSVILDFNKQVGDTLNVGVKHYYGSYYDPVVDSVTTGLVAGVPRRMQWATISLGGLNPHRYRTIEGIGASYNFPPDSPLYGEWLIPVCTLKCFRRGGQVLYSSDAAEPCFRKPPLSVAAAQKAAVLSRESLIMPRSGLRITDPRYCRCS